MSVRLLALLGLLVAAAGAVPAGRLDFERWEAIEESLRQMPPRLRGRWLRDRGIADQMLRTVTVGTDSELAVVGRWSYGTAYDIDGRMTALDTLLAYARGSGVSLLDYDRQRAIPVSLLADIDCAGLVSRVTLRDTLLFVGSASSFEVWDVSSPAAPHRLCQLALSLNDFALDDSLACIIGADDTFRVYSVADPASPRQLGACRDSGYSVVLLGGYAYVGDRYGLYVIDIRTPSAPHRIGSWGGDVISLAARNTTCYVTTGNPNLPEELNFHVLDVSSPATPMRIGGISGVGGYDIDLADSFAYLSGYYTGGHEFRILSIADSSNPVVLGSAATIAFNFGVWARPACGRAFVADEYGGLALIDITDPAQPQPDTVVLRAGSAEDIALDGGKAYVASQLAGMKVLDVTDPTRPEWVGDLTQAYRGITVFSVAARDSFAYVCWLSPFLRIVSVADPENPVMVAACTTLNHPEAMVIRDSFLYVAQDYRLQVLNVARPRQPRVVGTVNLPGMSYSVALVGSLAYVANGTEGLQIVSLANASSPQVVGSIDFPNPTLGVAVRDTFAYVAAKHLRIVSVARPDAPYVLDTVALSVYGRSVAVADTVLYVGTALGGSGYVAAFSIADPIRPVLLSQLTMPSGVNRLVLDGRLVYAACGDAGLLVVEAGSTGVADRPSHPGPADRCRVIPTVTARWVTVRPPTPKSVFRVVNAAGQQVQNCSVDKVIGGDTRIDLGRLPPGVYYVLAGGSGRSTRYKVVKQ
ncbi:MAG: hypothetical protein R6X13_10110 [bacterium]